MIPMQQLHTPVYDRMKVFDAIGSEEAVNAIGVKFVKHAPLLITQLEIAFVKNDFNTMQLVSLKLATLAHGSGAKQISEFAKTIFQETTNEDDFNKDTVAISLSCIQNSIKEFVILLNQYIERP